MKTRSSVPRASARRSRGPFFATWGDFLYLVCGTRRVDNLNAGLSSQGGSIIAVRDDKPPRPFGYAPARSDRLRIAVERNTPA